MRSTFRSLQFLNFRLWCIGALVSNIGTWMQRTAQDWLVYNELTHQDATAMGIVMALQFGPQLLLAPVSGVLADRMNRRHLLIGTQAAMAVLAVGLGTMVITGTADLWHVYAFALGLGIVATLDGPARQTVVSELVRDEFVPNAVALNSMSFNVARMIGPAVAGLLVAAIGSGWVFLLNAISFAVMIGAILALRTDQLRVLPRAKAGRGLIREGFRYVRGRGDIIAVLTAIFLIGTFGLNFAVFIAGMARTQFGLQADGFGVLSSVMAIGSVVGTLASARRERPRLRFIFGAGGLFGVACVLAALAPNPVLFGGALILCGLTALTVMTSANAYVQTTTEPALRGRVMALYFAIFMGGTPLGAPVVGWISDSFGPPWALVAGAASGVGAAVVGLVWYWRSQHLRLAFDRTSRFHVTIHG
ncbi:MFS transporter [Tersicoccus solisilvae]|uniref:MFS transporter n=1 Tax=Tersicoccus solisilvae TaxID=1882339 RepID=A0ABQ1P9T3_9MICC|nr:MFS transporter [Tersicoccus solisilvae]GGC89581.1 MFS transporter [Tersicoccus solisilvae]